ncbi:unnamed protein product [Adineta steineri]|uniref:Caveolin n=1 Tax=Adineta steineri TaxID=433720 RepID=A0A814JNK8_9BILA|nr:unnamed protein product [Adineta steineri]CAF3970380.1 unnamed protein product [Adineta steineri]
MEDKLLVDDYLHNKLKQEIENVRSLFASCGMSSIRWVQRYSHCYSILCSFMCIPLWILIVPIAFILDICTYLIVSIVFIISFILYIFIAPCKIAFRFSSCSAAWNPVNIYRYSLLEALKTSEFIFMFFQIFWLCYCGSGELEGGAPICCSYLPCNGCRRVCNHATHVEINEHTCTIL